MPIQFYIYCKNYLFLCINTADSHGKLKRFRDICFCNKTFVILYHFWFFHKFLARPKFLYSWELNCFEKFSWFHGMHFVNIISPAFILSNYIYLTAAISPTSEMFFFFCQKLSDSFLWNISLSFANYVNCPDVAQWWRTISLPTLDANC